jgi:uncharacterized linocin/CFP29 family protein
MSDYLRRSLAPLSAQAWKAVDEAASRVLKDQLTARTLVDYHGPLGPTAGAINEGRIELAEDKTAEGVCWGIRKTQPLIEARVAAVVDQLELDNIERGCADPNVDALETAARQIALFEESAIYNGFSGADRKGMVNGAKHVVKLPREAADFPRVVAEAVKILSLQGIGGPFALVMGAEPYFALMHARDKGYPARRLVLKSVESGVFWSPGLQGAVVMSTRGGDFELTVGQDLAVGYASHDRDKVELYLTESFAFRVLSPEAAVSLPLA